MRAACLTRSLLAAALALGVTAPARAELRVSDLDVFLNDQEVTVHVVLLGAVPDAFQGDPGRHSDARAVHRRALALQTLLARPAADKEGGRALPRLQRRDQGVQGRVPQRRDAARPHHA